MSTSPAPCTPPLPATRPYVAMRHDGWTYQRQVDFLVALDITRVVSRACAAVGLSVTSYYNFRRRPGGARFALACDTILQRPEPFVPPDASDDPIPERVEAVYRMGKFVGTRRRDDLRRLFARLARLDRVAERS